jgi:hypothetical protein
MNKLFYTKYQFGGVSEFAVNLETGTDQHVSKVVKTRYFDSHETAWKFFSKIVKFKHLSPFDALRKFNTFEIRRKNVLKHVVRQNQRIKHRINLPDGSYSVWVGRLQGDLIHRTDEKGDTSYTSLSAFALAHYKEVHPTRKSVNGWKECKAKVHGEWVKLEILREIHC